MKTLSSLLALSLVAPRTLQAAEGMWTFHAVPAERIGKAVGFTPSQAWLDHVRLSSVRLNDGGSGAFVSNNGLLITNHHVALGQLQKASTPEADYVKEGFFAKTLAEEYKAPDLEVNVLVGMEDVTARVAAAIKPGATQEEANAQRKAEIARIEKESTDSTGLRSDVVELYDGGEYWLYRYKKFTDVRLVMAPEAGAAFYGGDHDNFTYPRYDLDMAFFRVYEDGKPYQPPHFLKWNEKGLKDGEAAFVSGHPGSTERLKTLSQLQTIKDLENPAFFEILSRSREALLAYSAEGEEQARQAKSRIFSMENSLKVYRGRIDALKKPELMAKKAAEEKELRDAVEKDPVLKEAYGAAWDEIAAVQKLQADTFTKRTFQRMGAMGLSGLANTIVHYVREVAKPNAERWAEFRESGLESLHARLFSPAPLYAGLEKKALATSLRLALEKLGAEDAFVKAAMDGKTPEQVAEDAVSRTRLFEVAYRKELIAGGQAAVDASPDPLLRLAAKLAPFVQENRTWYEKFIEAAEVAASTLISKARFAVYGKTAYPDATFTLRLSYGQAKGYEEGTTLVPHKTTFFGLYDRAESFDHQPPFNLPAKVAAARGRLDLSTPLNFVTTNDIIGGNSGSPVINKDGEYVGLIFDGNIQSLEGDFIYDETQNRAVAVHSAGMLAALTRIYGMTELVAELTGKAVDAAWSELAPGA